MNLTDISRQLGASSRQSKVPASRIAGTETEPSLPYFFNRPFAPTLTHDEWAVGRRYLTPAFLTLNEALSEADLAEATAA